MSKVDIEWISVKNEFPEDFLDVLFVAYFDDEHRFVAKGFRNSKFYVWEDTYAYKSFPENVVTHWSFLPKLPK